MQNQLLLLETLSISISLQSETSIHVKNYDLERRRLSADVGVSRSMLDLKQREGLNGVLF